MFKKKYLLFFSLLILVVFLFTSCLLKPPVTEGILKGQVMVPEGSAQVKELTGQALPDATVNIIDLSTGEVIATTTTDANGHYQVFVPAGGPYLLQAIKDGVKIQRFTPQVEAGIEYDLGIADCATTAVTLIAQTMMDAEDYPDDLADINLADIEADSDFNDVMSIVCSIIEAGGDPAESVLVQQAIEDFLHPPATAEAVIDIAAILGVTAPVTGATPVTTITATVQYTGTVAWAPADDPFLGGQAYTATITLTPKAGFTLTGVAANFFAVAGAVATNPINSGVVTAVFPATLLVVGASYGGGIVAYILQSGEDPDYVINKQHGLIAATADQSGGTAWSNITTNLVGTTGTAIGTGQANTTAIVGQAGCASGAAKLCDDLTLNTYSDWYLPSKDELNKLYLNRVAIGGFANNRYWSSSENNAKKAWNQNFNNGNQNNSNKNNNRRIRAVRAF